MMNMTHIAHQLTGLTKAAHDFNYLRQMTKAEAPT